MYNLSRTDWLIASRRVKKVLRLFRLHPLDAGPELAQLFVKMFVAAVDVVNAAHFRDSICFQSGEHQRSGGAQVARHYRRAEKMIHSVNHRSGAVQADLRSHAL